MKIIFFGSDNFAVPSLKAVFNAGCSILNVITQPDKKSGRGMHLHKTPVKIAAEQLNLNISQPKDINQQESVEFIKSLNADLFIVIAYGQILSEELLTVPRLFSINLHASLLPRYRGAAPVNWAIINGDKETGVSIIKLVKKMDAGPVLLQQKFPVKDDDTSISLEDKLSDLGAKLLLGLLKVSDKKDLKENLQNESDVTFAPKLSKNLGLINWSQDAGKIHDLVRGILPWPGAYTFFSGKMLKVFKTEVLKENISNSYSAAPGTILETSNAGLIVKAGRDNIVIRELQLEGKRRMSVKEFIAGHKINSGEILISKK